MERSIHSLKVLLVVLLSFFSSGAFGQLTLSTSPYQQDFDGIGTALPTGWTVRSTANATALGTSVALTTTKTAWADTGGSFKNLASADGLASNTNSANQGNSTDRALGVKQSGSFADAGAAFVLQLANTTGKSSFNLSFKLQSLDTAAGRTVTWVVQYGLGTSPTSFTTVTTTPASITTSPTWGSTNVSVSLPAAIADQSQNVWIRVVALTASTGAGTRPTSAIDDVSLSWSAATAPAVALSDNGTQIAAGNVVQGTSNHILSSFKLDATSANGILNSASFLLSGTYQAADVTGFKLWYNSTNTLTGATQLGTTQTSTSSGSGDLLSFSGLTQTITVGASGYFWLTADISATATATRTIKAESIANADLTFASGTKSGSASAAGIQTIIANTTPVLTPSVSTLSGFTYVAGSGPSNVQSFSLSGTNLDGSQSASLLPGDNWQISTNQSTWVGYSDGPLVINNYNGSATTIYVRLKAGLSVATYNNASNDIIAITGYGVTPSPSVSLSGTVTAPVVTTTLTADGSNSYTYVEGSGPSTENTYHVSGANLTANLVLTAPTNYEVSTTTGSGFAASVSLTPASGSVASTQVFVRLKSGLTGATYNGNLVLSTTGIANKTIALTGSVTIPVPANDLCANPVTLTVNNATATNGTLKGATITAPFSGTNQVDVWYKFVVTHTADYTITLDGFSGDMDFDLFNTGCPASTGSYIGRGFTVNKPETLTMSLTAGTYYIRVNSSDAASSTSVFNIAVTASKFLSSNGTTTLTFGNVNKGSNSIAQTINVSGAFLTASAAVTVTAPTYYEVSLTGTSNDFHASVNLTADVDGFLTSTPVYVRFNTINACGATSGNVNISGGGATAVNVAVTGTALVSPTTATAGTAMTATGFTANWGAVTDATNYKVNVYKKTNNEQTVLNATFDDLAGTGGNDGTWSGNVGTNSLATYTSAGWAFGNAGGGAQCIKAGTGSNPGSVTTPVLTGLSGAGTLTFRAGGFGTDGTVLSVSISGGGSVTGNVSNTLVNGAFTTYTVNITGGTASSKLVFSSASGKRFFIDDIKVVAGGIVETPVSGSPFTVTAPATSYVVNGLDANTQYYYTVEALVGACSSVKSNEIAVTTSNNVIWNGTSWNNTNGPTKDIDAVIEGPYTVNASFEVKDLAVTTGTLDIKANQIVTIYGALSQTTEHSITVESDGGLVQKEGSTHDNKKIYVKRDANVPANQYNLWTSPVTGQDLYNLYGSGSPVPANKVMEYITSNDTFKPVAAGTLSVFGKGYSVIGLASNNVTAQFDGVPNNGTNQITASTAGDGYNLIGNPYPSNMDLGLFYIANAAMIDQANDNNAYFWDNASNTATGQYGGNYTGDNYATYNFGGTGNPAPRAGASKIPTHIVKPGQGFIVKAKSTATAFTYNNTMRTTDTGGVYFKGATNAGDKYWLELTTPKSLIISLAVTYDENAENSFDKYDSTVFNANASDLFYTKSTDAQKLAIQGRKGPLETTDVVAVGIKAFEAGNYSIKLADTRGIFDADQNVYIKDNELGKVVNLRDGDYNFTLNKGLNDTRFEIVYKEGVLGIDNVKAQGDIIVYKSKDNFVIKSNKNNITSVELYDMNGRLILVNNKASKEIAIPHGSLLNSTYVLKISQGKEILTKKVIK